MTLLSPVVFNVFVLFPFVNTLFSYCVIVFSLDSSIRISGLLVKLSDYLRGFFFNYFVFFTFLLSVTLIIVYFFYFSFRLIYFSSYSQNDDIFFNIIRYSFISSCCYNYCIFPYSLIRKNSVMKKKLRHFLVSNIYLFLLFSKLLCFFFFLIPLFVKLFINKNLTYYFYVIWYYLHFLILVFYCFLFLFSICLSCYCIFSLFLYS